MLLNRDNTRFSIEPETRNYVKGNGFLSFARNRSDTRFSMKPRTRNYVKGYGFLSFAKNVSNKYRKQLLDTGPDASKKVVYKVAEVTGEFLGNKISEKIVKPVEEIIILPGKEKKG